MRQVTECVSMNYMLKLQHNCFTVMTFLLFIFSTSCTPSGRGILGATTDITSQVDSATKSAPFAYDAAADTISYNSCISTSVNSSNIHGLKIGASEGFTSPLTGAVKAGVKLRSDFLQQIGKSFKPEYPASTITPAQVLKILGKSDANKDAYLQIAVRRKSDLLAIPDFINLNGKVARAGIDVTVFNQTLYSGYLGYLITKNISFTDAGVVLSEGPRVYNLSNDVDPVNIEGVFKFNATADSSVTLPSPPSGSTENFGYAEGYPQVIRDSFNKGFSSTGNINERYVLALTFGGNEDVPAGDTTGTTNHINLLKRPSGISSGDYTKAYGRSYALKFTSPNSSISNWMTTQLTQVKEYDLSTGVELSGSGGVSWLCENYLIMRQDHWDNNRVYNSALVDQGSVEPSCVPLIASDLTDPTLISSTTTLGQIRKEKIQRLRRHYPENLWNIGLYLPGGQRSSYTLPNRSAMTQICLSPKKSDDQCYLPTTTILGNTAENALDVGIQYDTTKDCYTTSVGPQTDDNRKKGRCAQFASICTRNGGY